MERMDILAEVNGQFIKENIELRAQNEKLVRIVAEMAPKTPRPSSYVSSGYIKEPVKRTHVGGKTWAHVARPK